MPTVILASTLAWANTQAGTPTPKSEAPSSRASRAGASAKAAPSKAASATPNPASARQQLKAMGVEPTIARLTQYAAQGDATTVELLLAAGVSAKAAEPVHRTTPLHNAAAQGHAKLAQRLIDAGAIVDAADENGATPLIDAAYYGHDAVVALLLEKGANANVVPKQSPTALIAAIQSGNLAVVRRLLDAGAKAEQPDFAGATPRQVAERAQRSDVTAMIDAAIKNDGKGEVR